MAVRYDLNLLAEQRVADLHADATARRNAAAAQGHHRRRIRLALGHALVRAGRRLEAAPARPVVTP